MTDLNELKKLAQAAVAGPWIMWSYEGPSKHGGESHSVCHHVGGLMSTDHTCVATAIGETEDYAYANAAYIAAANPSVMLELIEREEKMRAEISRLREALMDVRECVDEEIVDDELASKEKIAMHVVDVIDTALDASSMKDK